VTTLFGRRRFFNAPLRDTCLLSEQLHTFADSATNSHAAIVRAIAVVRAR